MNIFDCLNTLMPAESLKKHLYTYSIIDIIMNEADNNWLRIYHYTKNWKPNVDLCTIDDSGGDHIHILFSDKSCIIKGFGHESDLSPYNYDEDEIYPDYDFYSNIPAELLGLLDDESLEKDLVTFCIYYDCKENCWAGAKQITQDWAADGYSDGADTLKDYAQSLDGYLEWFEEYYEMDLDKSLLQEIFTKQKISKEQILNLNPKADIDNVSDELSLLGAM